MKPAKAAGDFCTSGQEREGHAACGVGSKGTPANHTHTIAPYCVRPTGPSLTQARQQKALYRDELYPVWQALPEATHYSCSGKW
jgi:hypothetical protein